MLSRRNSVGRRRVDHQTPVLRRCRQIYIIDPNPSPSNHLQPSSRRLEHLACHLGRAANNQGVAERDLGAELLGTEVVGAIDIRKGLKQCEPRLAKLLGDEDGRLSIERGRGGDDDGASAGGGGGEIDVREAAVGVGEEGEGWRDGVLRGE